MMHVMSGSAAVAPSTSHHTGIVTITDGASPGHPAAMDEPAGLTDGAADDYQHDHNHEMLTVACLLALLAATLAFLAIPLRLDHVRLLPPIRVLDRLPLAPDAARPPSLIELSIRRT